uniref:S-locus F-box protein type-4 n=1 Tax=Solanum habrochaites TaxID=62890 RepID=A0A075TYR1_SOLHA|nr:S-locus F-box protein type-4 [Solanum habrochaites]
MVVMMKLLQDVVINILLMLPVKSLMRLKCLSKSCYTLVQSSTFVNLHLNRPTTFRDGLILFKRSIKQDDDLHKTILSFLSGDDENHLSPINPDLDVPCMTSNYSNDFDQFIGPCQGIVALMDNLTTVLFNPSTRNYRLLPPSPFNIPPPFSYAIECVGFGFDNISNDYKVIRILDVYLEDHGYPQDFEKKIEVYDVDIDFWRELDHADQNFPTIYWLPSSQMFYQGSCHWIGISIEDALVILSFDLSTETFHTAKTPDSCYFMNGPSYGLAVLNDTFTLICYPRTERAKNTNEFTYIWLRKDYSGCDSWIKKYTIKGLPIQSPLAIWRECLLLFQCSNGFLMSCNLRSNEVSEYNLHGSPTSLRVIIYKESLTLIPRGYGSSTQIETF